jgi:ribonuclease P protein component
VQRALRLPSGARLREAVDFTALRSGQRFASSCFQIQYRLTADGGARLGMAVSRRVSKRAVVRNRIRRQIRETFRLVRPGLPDCDVLVVARSASAGTTSATLRSELQSAWQRLAALKPSSATRTIRPARNSG